MGTHKFAKREIILDSQDNTWGWMIMLIPREEAGMFLKYEVGDGQRIFLWHDNWHPDGVHYLKYGYRIIYDATSSLRLK